tara:strand:- start:151 stop:288 length:138 start_codon:yes stop_codon:yes gene_type:complete
MPQWLLYFQTAECPITQVADAASPQNYSMHEMQSFRLCVLEANMK